MPLRRYVFVLVMLLLVAPLVAACGSSSSSSSSSATSSAGATNVTPNATAGSSAASPAVTSSPAAAAGTPATSASSTGSSLTVTDATGTKITLDHPAKRVVCLVGECEDILASLGLKPVAVNDTYGQDPHLWGDAAKSFTKIGGSFQSPNIEDIAKATPDLVIGIANADEQLRPAMKPIAPMYLTNPATYQDSLKDLENVGQLTGRTEQATAAAKKFTDELANLKAKSPHNVSTVLIYGAAPNFSVFTEGSLTPSVLSQIATYPIPAPPNAPGASDHEPGAIPGSLEELLKVNPDTLLIASFGNSKISEQLSSQPVWKELKAVKDKRVYEVNPNYYVFGRGPISLEQALRDAMSKLYPGSIGTATP